MRLPTSIEATLAAAFAAAVAFLVAPDFVKAKDGYAVEVAARAAAACDSGLALLRSAGAEAAAESGAGEGAEGKPPTLADVEAALSAAGFALPVWPGAADLSTLDLASTNGASVSVRLSGGPRRVDARDLEVDHAN